MITRFTLAGILFLLTVGFASAQYCPEPSGTTSTFNWMEDSWLVWVQPVVTQAPVQIVVPSPYHPNVATSQPNTNHLHSASGQGDYRPEDGWVLIMEEMGLVIPIRWPQFVLYNRFESKLRYFVFLAGIQANDVEIHVHFEKEQSYVTHVSAALEHAFTPMDVVEGYQDKKIMIAVPNKGFFAHGVWAMADIPIAYDPCTCQYTSALTISTITSTYSTFVLNLDGGGDITQVIGPAGSQNNRVTNAGQRFANITGGINSGISKGVSAYKTAGELAAVAERLMIGSANRRLTPDLIGTLNTIPGVNINAVTGITSPQANFLSAATNLLPGQADAINQVFTNRKLPDQLVPDWLKTAVPFASTAFALLDFIIGGGKSTPPQPMHFNADFSFNGEGNFTQSLPQASTTFYIPGSFSHPAAPEERLPVYDKVMGILNLVEQPVMLASGGESTISGSEGVENYIQVLSLLSEQPLKYALNPAAGMNIDDIRAALYFQVLNQWNTLGEGILVTPESVGLIEDEPGIWRTPYMPLSCLSAYSIKFPPMVPFPL